MTKSGYTHIIVPLEFYEKLKAEAQKERLSIWKFLSSLVRKSDGLLIHRSGVQIPSSPLSIFNNFDDAINLSGINTKEFEKFLRVRKGLSDSTIKTYLLLYKKFSQGKNIIARQDIENYLSISKNKRNNLAMLKALFRDFLGKDIVGRFKITKSNVKPKILPDKNKLLIFYNSLPSLRDKALFLLLACSGLRLGEALNLKLSDIVFQERMVIPNNHSGQTKHSWVSFYNEEAEKVLIQYLQGRDKGKLFDITVDRAGKIFKKTSHKTGIKVTPQTLRSVFARELGLKKVPDRYIDAFCGRLPQSVLARHYSDFSPEVLKEIYEKAEIKILA